jgi:uncharacterized protein YyaL (SSP411 family)
MQHTNSLIHSTSPYLLQHAHNPVNWFAWGDEALQKAKHENKPILLSIGYSSCHWCHVMERESFENEQTAAVMNEYFVNIKVDREERPDLDHIYMSAIQTLTGSGGWPLNVFLTPDLKPFYGGTYFPPKPMHNRASWVDVLMHMADAYKSRRDEVEKQAEQLLGFVTKNVAFKKNDFDTNPEILFSNSDFEKIFTQMEMRMDKQHGGFERAPKFLGTMNMDWLLHHEYFTKYNNQQNNFHHSKPSPIEEGKGEVAKENDENLFFNHVSHTLLKMSRGGIFDCVAGGIARYSTDAEWFAPHFEKMLYDNALFLQILANEYSLSKNEQIKITIEKIFDYLMEEMQDKNGGFYSALDADSEGVEGKYYVWTDEELKQLLTTDEYEEIKNLFNILPEGNWEHGYNILHTTLTPTNKIAYQSAIEKLKQERKNRIKPLLDNKQLLAWNALLISALSKCFLVLKDKKYKLAALNGLQFVEEKLINNSFPNLFHQHTLGKSKHNAYLDDYAFLMQAYLDAYALNFDESFLHKAYQIAQHIHQNFSNIDSPFYFFTSKNQTDVVARTTEVYDGALPSPNSVICRCFLKLSYLFDDNNLFAIAEKQLQEIKSAIVQHPTSFANWAIAAYEYTNGLTEIICTGNEAANFAAEIQTQFIPCKMIFISNKNTSIEKLKDYFSEQNKIYVCKNKSCLAPVNSVAEALKNI